jgi:hypothetical protein
MVKQWISIGCQCKNGLHRQCIFVKLFFLIFSMYLVQASFFIAYVVTSGWTAIASELFRLTTLISNFISRTFCSNADNDFEPPSIPYHSEIPRIRLFGLLGVTYFLLAPLILPFLLIYFCLGYIIFRNQVRTLFFVFPFRCIWILFYVVMYFPMTLFIYIP